MTYDYTDQKVLNYINRKGNLNERIITNLSACFRQWAAEDTHCKYLHSYVITFKLIFDNDVKYIFRKRSPERKLIYAWFKNNFDKITFVAEDDPQLEIFKRLYKDKVIKLKILPKVGCELFSKHVLEELNKYLESLNIPERVVEVETFEHGKNSAIYKVN